LVKLNRIYTKTGDTGSTGLGDGKRVRKDDPRVEAYGTVDEANAALGVALALAAAAPPGSATARLADLLRSIQHDLFDVGADLCCPITKDEAPGKRLRVSAQQTARLERAIDQYNEHLAPLTSFVLPGGSPLAAALHVARTVTRRAERLTVTLHETDKPTTNPETIKYLNRLSDLLFVLARVANDNGAGDVLWVPGANRPAT
jgi:cob(I)alamin adenosyltransferase